MGKRIMVVDDESDVCFVLGKVLGEDGYVVVSSLLLQHFKRLDRKVKVCFLTAGELYYGVYSDIFASLPANRFIRKPTDNERLPNRIKDIIADYTM